MNDKYDFDRDIKRLHTGSAKWDKPFDTKADDILPLWVADMDFACARPIQQALHQYVDQEVYGYTLGMDAGYRKAVCGWFLRRFDWKIDPSTIFYAPGVVSAIAYLLEILCEEGEGVVIQTPVYYPFRKKIEATKRMVIENPLLEDHGIYTMNLEELDRLFARKNVKGLILCSPHNPVGRVWTKAELCAVLELAKKHHKWIISDEIHADLIRQQHTQLPLATLADEELRNQLIICTAPSKSFNLAGLQNSNVIIHNSKYQQRWQTFVIERLSLSSANSFALAATKAAYNESEDWLNQVNAYLDENIRFATAYLCEHLPDAVVSPCEGTYLLWVYVGAYVQDKNRLERLMLDAGIVLDEGYLFGEQGECYERINVACTRALLTKCLQRMCDVLRHVKQEGGK